MGLLNIVLFLSDTTVQVSFAIGKWFLDWQIFILRTILNVVFLPVTVLTAAARAKQVSGRLRTLAVEYNALAMLAGDIEIKLSVAEKEKAILKEKLELALQQRARFKQRYLIMAAQVRTLENVVRRPLQGKEGDDGQQPAVVPLMVPPSMKERLQQWEDSPASPIVLHLAPDGLKDGPGSGGEGPAGGAAAESLQEGEEGEGDMPRRGSSAADPVLVLQQVPLTLDERRAAHGRRWEREREKVELEILGALRAEAQRACHACIALALLAALGAMVAYPGPNLPWGSAAGLVLLAVAMLFTLVAFGTRFPETAGSAVWAFAAVWFLVGVVTAPGIPYALPFLPTFIQNLSKWLTDTTVVALIGQPEE